MAGTAVDLSSYAKQQEYAGTTSSTVNEVDVLGPFPSGTRHLSFYFANASRVGHPGNGTKTTSDTMTDSDAHSPCAASQWFSQPYSGGKVYISSGTASTAYKVKAQAKTPKK